MMRRRRRTVDAHRAVWSIDTTGARGVVTVRTVRGRVLIRKTFTFMTSASAPALLRTLAACVRATGGRIARAAALDVVPGPGPFSRVRLGIVTANALAWALGIPLRVSGRRVKLARPEYSAPPSITPPTRGGRPPPNTGVDNG